MSTALLSSTYFGPVQWYQKLASYDNVLIERHDSFVKQTYRNRCVIATANGPLPLTVPIEREGKVRISDHGNWRHQHWNALVSAYGDSPFFEYYADDIRPFFHDHWKCLYDFNLDITKKMCELLDITPNISQTDHYISEVPDEMDDFRDVIHPKHPQPDPTFVPTPYYQVYARRHGFIPNASVLDLLFNMGSESIFYIKATASR